MGNIKNMPQVLRELDMHMARAEKMSVAAYRKAVWEVFCDILENTPQYTGQGVANWNIGVDAPDMSLDVGAGDDQSFTASGKLSRGAAANLREKGDRYWIDFAKVKNKQRLFLIKRNSRVFITNAAVGDTDGGESSAYYIESLQEDSYWVKKLRRANKPYITAVESLMNYNLLRVLRGDLEAFI